MRFSKPALFALCLVTTVARAERLRFDVPLTTEEAVPPPVAAENARGIASVLLDTETGEISLSGSYAGLSSNLIHAHIHGPAPRGQDAGALVTLGHTGGTEGRIFLDEGIADAELIGFILGGLTFVNLHTERNGPVELRGQIENPRPVAEAQAPALGTPGAVLLATTLIALGAIAIQLRASRSRRFA